MLGYIALLLVDPRLAALRFVLELEVFVFLKEKMVIESTSFGGELESFNETFSYQTVVEVAFFFIEQRLIARIS